MASEPAGGRWLLPLITLIFRLWSATWRFRVENAELLAEALARGPVVFAFWHGEQLALLRAHAGRGFVGLVSLSRDGELLARVLQRFGYRLARGSSSRGALGALRSCREALQNGRSPALAIDGPRGPRHVPQLGALALAAHSGAPVLYVVSDVHPVLRLRSWDRFEIPLPWARVRVRYGRLDLKDSQRETLAAARQTLMDGMARLNAPGSTPP